MKLRITEEQASRLKLINEDVNLVAKFEEFCNAKVKEINTLYVRIISLSVAEVISNEIDLNALEKHLYRLETSLLNVERKTSSSVADESLKEKIDVAYNKADRKLSLLQLVLLDLEKLQESANEHRVTDYFGDVKPMDISPES